MKKDSKLSKKISMIVAGSLALLGGVGSVVNADNTTSIKDSSNSMDYTTNKKQKPQLVLSVNPANMEMNKGYSHGSHSSHGSHGSHSSHSSHGSSSI